MKQFNRCEQKVICFLGKKLVIILLFHLKLAFSLQASLGTRRRAYNHRAFVKTPFHQKCYSRKKCSSFRQILLHASNDNNSMIEEEYDDWEAGINLKSDVQKLRMAVWEINADSDLKEKERLHLLDEFARQRREVLPDVKKYLISPIVITILLLYIQRKDSTTWGMVFAKNILQLFLRAMNVMYTISIFVPLVMHRNVAKDDRNKSYRQEDESTDFMSESASADSRKDCSNYSLCLLENWITSIYPSAILHFAISGSSFVRKEFFSSGTYTTYPSLIHFEQTTPIFIFGMSLSRLVTRLGAASSLHQFPKLLYELRRSNQPRPVARIPFMLRRTIEIYLQLLPLGLISDTTNLYSTLPQVKAQVLSGNIKRSFNPLSILLLMSILVPLVHIIALSRIVRIGHFTNISLGMNQEKALKLLDNKDTDGFKLRYKLQWRPPFRILSSGRGMLRDFVLFLFRGWGEQASIMNGSNGSVASSGSEPYILTLVGKEMEQIKMNNISSTLSDRSKWVQDASDRMARIHEQSYRDKNYDVSVSRETFLEIFVLTSHHFMIDRTHLVLHFSKNLVSIQHQYEMFNFDPFFSISFQYWIGIGMSMDFDHDTRLRQGESPSVHRLRARAAKSIIKCFNNIPSHVKKQVEHIQDEEEKSNEYKKLIRKKKKEMFKVAKEISLLIPVNAASPEGKDLDVFSMKMSEANQVDSVSLPWLDDVGKKDEFYDPYLSFEDAFLYDQKQRTKNFVPTDDADGDDYIFKDVDTVVT